MEIFLHFHVLHSCVIGNRLSLVSVHTLNARFSYLHLCRRVSPVSKGNGESSQLPRTKMFCFFVVKLVGLFPLIAEHIDKVLSSCKLAATSSVAVTKAFVPSAFSAKETQPH